MYFRRSASEVTTFLTGMLLCAFACAQAPAAGAKTPGQQAPGAGVQSPGGQQGGGGGTAFFDSQMLAYGSVNELAYSIAHSVCEGPHALKDGSKLIIYDQTSFQNLQAWQALKTALATLDKEYGTLTDTIAGLAPGTAPSQPPGAAGIGIKPFSAPAAAAAVAGGPFFAGSDVSGLIGALAASTTNTATTFTVPDAAIAVELIHQFRRSDQFAHTPCSSGALPVTYYPLLGNAGRTNDPNAIVQPLFDTINKKRVIIQEYLATRPQAASSPQAQTSGGNPGSQPPQGMQNSSADPLATAFTDLNTQYDAMVATITTSIAQNQAPSSGSGSPAAGVTSIVQGSQLEVALNDPNVYILYADVLAAGGIQRDIKNFFTVIFTGDFISYSGGVILNYALVKGSDGSVIDANVLRYRAPYTRLHHAHEIQSVERTNSNDNLLTLCNHEIRASWSGGADSSDSGCDPTKKTTATVKAVPPPAPGPVPTVSSLSSSTATQGESGFTITVNGTNFLPNATVKWDGIDRHTRFVSATQLTADLTDEDLQKNNTFRVTVKNPDPDGATAPSVSFTVTAPAPSLSSITPATVVAGQPGFTLAVHGTNFTQTSAISWNETDLDTVYVSPTQLQTAISADDIAKVGNPTIKVSTPTPGGGPAGTQILKIVAPHGIQMTCTLSDKKTPQLEFYFNPGTGRLSYGGQTQFVTVVDDNTHYGFIAHAWGNLLNKGFASATFNVTVSKSSGALFMTGDWTVPASVSSGTGTCKVASTKNIFAAAKK
jgi:hypothetical protein